jgi:hypothetical protein
MTGTTFAPVDAASRGAMQSALRQVRQRMEFNFCIFCAEIHIWRQHEIRQTFMHRLDNRFHTIRAKITSQTKPERP